MLRRTISVATTNNSRLRGGSVISRSNLSNTNIAHWDDITTNGEFISFRFHSVQIIIIICGRSVYKYNVCTHQTVFSLIAFEIEQCQRKQQIQIQFKSDGNEFAVSICIHCKSFIKIECTRCAMRVETAHANGHHCRHCRYCPEFRLTDIPLALGSSHLLFFFFIHRRAQ